jgi:hypothetical protein
MSKAANILYIKDTFMISKFYAIFHDMHKLDPFKFINLKIISSYK